MITEEKIEIAANERKEREKDPNGDIQKVLDGLHEGKTNVEIAKDVNFGDTRVCTIKKQLIKER